MVLPSAEHWTPSGGLRAPVGLELHILVHAHRSLMSCNFDVGCLSCLTCFSVAVGLSSFDVEMVARCICSMLVTKGAQGIVTYMNEGFDDISYSVHNFQFLCALMDMKCILARCKSHEKHYERLLESVAGTACLRAGAAAA